MGKLIAGICFLLLGCVLVVWVVYNVFVERQPTFNPNPLGALFVIGLFAVGGKWVLEWRSRRKAHEWTGARTGKARRPFRDDD